MHLTFQLQEDIPGLADLADFINHRFAIRKIKDFFSTGKFSNFFPSSGFVSPLISGYLLNQAPGKFCFWMLYLLEGKLTNTRNSKFLSVDTFLWALYEISICYLNRSFKESIYFLGQLKNISIVHSTVQSLKHLPADKLRV